MKVHGRWTQIRNLHSHLFSLFFLLVCKPLPFFFQCVQTFAIFLFKTNSLATLYSPQQAKNKLLNLRKQFLQFFVGRAHWRPYRWGSLVSTHKRGEWSVLFWGICDCVHQIICTLVEGKVPRLSSVTARTFEHQRSCRQYWELLWIRVFECTVARSPPFKKSTILL